MAAIVYILCALTSLTCAVLLLRAYRQNGVRLLFWSGLCFIGLALNGGSTKGEKIFAPAGSLLTEAFNDGPATYSTMSKNLDLIGAPGGVATMQELGVQLAAENAGNIYPPPTQGSNTYLQDTRDFYALHGGKSGSCNILMADGSVKTFNDTNGDKFLNPGFPVGTLTPSEALTCGFKDGTIELAPGDMFSGVFLAPRPKTMFE